MKCLEGVCFCNEECALFGCLLSNPLLIQDSKKIHDRLKVTNKKWRVKYIIDILQEKQPPKVRRSHIDRWWSLRNFKGIDLDKDVVSKTKRKKHTYSHHVSKKKQIPIQKTNQTKKKKRGSIVGDYLKRHAADSHLSVNTNVDDKEKILFLQSQTPEQLELSKKHGWMIAKMLTEPQMNFHEPANH